MLLYILLLLFYLSTTTLCVKFGKVFSKRHPRPTDYKKIKGLVRHKIVPGVNLAKRGSILFDCVKYDCGASVLVCTSTARDCFLNCNGYATCDGVKIYSSARKRTEFSCIGKTACMGGFFNCGPVRYRGADGFLKLPGYDKENVAGIRDNSLLSARRFGKCSLWCGGVGCSESHLDVNGNWRYGVHVYAGKQVDAFSGAKIAVRLQRFDSFRPRANVVTVHCDSSLACGHFDYYCKKTNKCRCKGKCKEVKVTKFPPQDIPPTAKCMKKPIGVFKNYVTCKANFDCNVYCKKIVCQNCQEFNCNGDDACAGTKDRGLKLQKIDIRGDKELGVSLLCNGDRTCKDMGGISAIGYHLPRSQRGFHITECNKIVCSGDNSCEASYFNVKCIKAGCYLECGDNACLYSEMKFDWMRRLTCSAQNTCAYLKLTTGIIADDWGFSCGPNGCNSAVFNIKIHPSVTHLSGFSCNGPSACYNFKINIIANHDVSIGKVVCGAAKACHRARFTSSGKGIVTWPDVECGGRRGPCENFKINGKYVLEPLKKKKMKTKKTKKKKKVPIHRR